MPLILTLVACAATAATSQTELGRALFSNPALSADDTVSCATCHDPARAFTDGRPVAAGVYGRPGTRNTPSLFDAAQAPLFAWDGRRASLEDQIHDAFLNPVELGLRDEQELEAKLAAQNLKPQDAVAALAAYVRTLATPPSDPALPPAARRGQTLFRGRARCAECHRDDAASDQQFHHVDLELPEARDHLAAIALPLAALPLEARLALIPTDPQVAALGRFVVTLDPRDISTFKTPSLRHAADTAPYFHDGSVGTLEAAVDREIYYRDEEHHLVVNPAERGDLVAYLRSLSSPRTSP